MSGEPYSFAERAWDAMRDYRLHCEPDLGGRTEEDSPDGPLGDTGSPVPVRPPSTPSKEGT